MTARTFTTVAAVVMLSVLGVGAAHAVTPGQDVRLAQIEWGCTIGFTAHDPRGRPIAITAGHCAGDSYVGGEAYTSAAAAPIGRTIAATSIQDLDYAVIALAHGPVDDTPIGAPGPTGQTVCKVGRMTGRTCGPVVAVTDTEVVAKLALFPGDSGSPLIDQHGRVIGILSHTDEHATPAQTWSAAVTQQPQLATFPRADRIVDAMRARHLIG